VAGACGLLIYPSVVIDWLAARHWGVRAAIAILSGVLTALGFQPFGWWALLPFGVAGLTLAVLGARRVRGAAGLGFAYGIGFLLIGIGWMQVIFVQAMFGLVGFESLFYAQLRAGRGSSSPTPASRSTASGGCAWVSRWWTRRLPGCSRWSGWAA
jgi:apolipoprotein N-acyltransferase